MADSNFAQFAARGNPWVQEKTWDRELRDAGNPLCATGRRNSAIAFTAKSHNMRFPEPQQPPLTGHVREGVTDTARVLAARNRLREIHTVPETASLQSWQNRSHAVAAASERDARRSSKIAYYANFVNPKRPNPRITSPLIFRNYSEIVSLFGSIEGYLNYG